MPGSQLEGVNGGLKKARDASLTWDVPPPLEDATAAAAGRPAFAAVAAKHLEALVQQLLVAEGVEAADAWAPVVCQLAQAAATALSPTAAVAHGKLDPRYYIKVKRLVCPGAAPSDSSLLHGVAARKSLAHKRMRSSIAQPRIMLLAGGIEAEGRQQAYLQRGSGGGMASGGAGGSTAAVGSTSTAQLSSFDGLLEQEQQYLAAAVERIASFSPDVLLVERSVGRYAQELLLARDISLVLNVKAELLDRLARCTGAQVAPSVEQLTNHCVGFCKEFEVESMQPSASSAAAAAAAAAATASSPGTGSTDISPRTAQDAANGHAVADPAALRKAALLGGASGVGGAGSGATRALMLFRGCPRPLGCTILLRSSDAAELRKVKRVATFAVYSAYWGLLESALLADQLAAAAAAVLPGGLGSQQPEAVAGAADAVASTSFLATAVARGRQAILSASPHVSVALEQGAPAADLELPPEPGEDQQQQQQQEQGEPEPASPASSADSTAMWVLPAEAGSATFTVSGSQTELELEEQQRQQEQQSGIGGGEGGSGTATPVAGGSVNGGPHDTVLVPGSPQDPLHQAAKELALQQLQLTGSEPTSPAAGPSLGTAAGEAELGTAQPQGVAASFGDAPSTPLSPRSAANVPSQQGAAAAAGGGGGTLTTAGTLGGISPGTAAYRSQQLWLAISCKNPAKGILCEPSHSHCMEFYADTDLPLAAFISAAAPPNRKCPHPQCGDGAPLHLRSFMHANGLVTLSSVRLPAGKELPPDGRVWLWLRPAARSGGNAADPAVAAAAAAAVRRVALSAEAACLSFAHLLCLLLDARHLALGGQSLQRDFVRYLGAGSTVLCLHYSPAPAYAMRMPPRQVGLLADMEGEWLQEEIKQLTEEGDEAFGAIEYALGEQLRQLEGGAAADPEFQQMWLDTLAETRASFLEMVQDTITLLDSPLLNSQQQQQQQQGGSCDGDDSIATVPHVVWELNRLRAMLAAVVLQWATCLHEGSPSSHAAPPSSATSALTSALQARRQVAHSRHVSMEAPLAVEPSGEGLRPGCVSAEEGVQPSPFSQDVGITAAAAAAGEEQQLGQGMLPAPAGQRELQPPPPAQQAAPEEGAAEGDEAAAVVAAAARARRQWQVQHSPSGSLGRHFLEDIQQQRGLPSAAPSEAAAPSLWEEEGGGGGTAGGTGGSLAASPHVGLPIKQQAPIPTGLVARYISLFNQRGEYGGATGGGAGSAASSPARGGSLGPPSLWSQRTREWVQTSSPTAAEAEQQQEQEQERRRGEAVTGSLGGSAAASDADSDLGSPVSPGGRQEPEPAAAPQQPQQRQWQPQRGLPLLPRLPSLGRVATEQRAREEEEEEQEQQLESKPSGFFRLDLTNPDPELVRALTPTRHRSSADEGGSVSAPAAGAAAAAPPGPASVAAGLGSRLEQIAARLGRMSLSQSFTERRRSFRLSQTPSADQLALEQPAQAAEDLIPQQQQEQQQQGPGLLGQQQQQPEALSPAEAADTETPQPAAAPAAPSEKQQQAEDVGDGAGAAEAEPSSASLPRMETSVSHFDEWGALLQEAAPTPPAAAGTAAAAAGETAGTAAPSSAGVPPVSLPLQSSPSRQEQQMQKTASGRLGAIDRLQEAPMPPALSAPATMQLAGEGHAGKEQAEGAELAPAASAELAIPGQAEPAPLERAASVPASNSTNTSVGPEALATAADAATGSSATEAASAAPAASAAATAAAAAAAVPAPGQQRQPSPASLSPPPQPPPPTDRHPSGSKLLQQLLGRLRADMQPGHMPLTTGKVELSGRALLPGGADGMRVAIFDDEPTSIIAYFLATKDYQQYLHDAVADILFGGPGQRSSGISTSAPAAAGAGTAAEGQSAGDDDAAAVPGSWQSVPGSPRGSAAAAGPSSTTLAGGRRNSSLVPGLQQQQQGGGLAAAAAAALAAVGGAAPVTSVQAVMPEGAAAGAATAAPPVTSTRVVTQDELAAEQSGDWQVLFHEQQLDCQLALEDPSPGMPWGRAKFQVTAYYAPQFAELRRRCVAGGEAAFLASISRCRKWASRGGKSSVYFARTCDKRYIIKQLSRSERQSFLEFASDYFRYTATMLHRGQDTCLAKILGVFQVSVQYTGGRGAPGTPPFGGKEGAMDLLITENVFYGREPVARIYDLKGSERDRYAADDPGAAGVVLLDENLKELNLTSPTLVGPRAYARLQRALWSDTSFLAGLGVMDYSLLVGVDKQRQELVVGVIDYCRQYTWDKQVETWVKKSGILGGAGKDPTVISPKQYSRRFRIAMSSYFTVVPAWEPPETPLDPDAM